MRLAARELARINTDLLDAMAQMKILEGLLPICSNCKSIRDEDDQWASLETYVQEHTAAKFSHGLCPACQQAYLDDLGKLTPRA